MKSFVVFAVVLFLAAANAAASYGGGGAAAPASGGYGGGASIPAPPCPKNYLFSCAPNLSPAPCSPPASGGYGGAGGAGAYSENYPVYAVPQYVNGYHY